MKNYRVVFLNRKMKLSRQKDLEQMQETIDRYAAEGWELQQVVSPNDLNGAVIGFFCRERENEG